jgi:hypothetical protein
MSAPTLPEEVDELIERMRAVRASGYDHAGALHGKAKRLVDWKEYVRSKPLVSVAVASLVGFSVVRGTFRGSSPSTSSSASGLHPAVTPSSSNQATWKRSVISLATNVATTALRHYFSTLIQRGKMEGGFHDRFRDAGSKEERVGSD